MFGITPNFVMSDTLIPREQLFQLPSCIAIKISPDGQRLAYVGADEEGIMNLFVSPNLSLEGAQNLTHFKDPKIRVFHWTPKGDKILLLKDKDGTGEFRLYCLDLASCALKDLTASFDRINAKIFQISAMQNKALIGINQRNPRFHDLYLLDLETGSLALNYQNDRFVNFVLDEKLETVLKMHMNADSSVTLLDRDDLPFITLSAEDAFHTECLRYRDEDRSLYLLDNRDSNTTQLKKIFFDKTQQDIVLGHDNKSDIQDVLFEKGMPVAYATNYALKTWHPLGEQAKKDLDDLTAKMGSNFSIVSTPDQHGLWVVKNVIPEKGTEFWLYDRPSQTLTHLFSSLEISHLASMHPLIIRARDGMQLVSYLTIPKNMDVGGKSKKPLPLVVIPHGGPFKGRDSYTYSPYHQWLANRGYAVLSVNFRLSSGFGKDFVNAGNGQWGKKAHEDILDAVQWCVDSGIADREKLAIFGSSYGGYEALASLTFSPDVFACAIAACGPSNLKTVLNSVPFYWELPSGSIADKMHFFTKNAFITSMGGNPDNEEDIPFLESCSPLNYVDRIKKPLLLVHGANDPIVSVAESDQIFDSMQKRALPVTYLSFPDEGHGIAKFENLLCELAYSEWLLAKILGGTFEPLAEELLKKSSIQIRSSSMPHEEVIEHAYGTISCAAKDRSPK